jgi:hypothetical protein
LVELLRGPFFGRYLLLSTARLDRKIDGGRWAHRWRNCIVGHFSDRRHRIDWRTSGRKMVPPNYRVKFLHKIFVRLVIVGVAGELLSDADIFLFSHRLQTIQETEVAILYDRATKAELEIARIKAPRSLTPEQMKAIAEKLLPFAGTSYDMLAVASAEGTFLSQLNVALSLSSKWQFISVEYSPHFELRPVWADRHHRRNGRHSR